MGPPEDDGHIAENRSLLADPGEEHIVLHHIHSAILENKQPICRVALMEHDISRLEGPKGEFRQPLEDPASLHQRTLRLPFIHRSLNLPRSAIRLEPVTLPDQWPSLGFGSIPRQMDVPVRGSLIMLARLCLVILLVFSLPAYAQGDPDAGQELVSRWCTSCHLVGAEETDAAETGTDAAPPLSMMLTEEQLTADQVWGWLADPHPPMPGLSLSRHEIDDIIAYMETLRAE